MTTSERRASGSSGTVERPASGGLPTLLQTGGVTARDVMTTDVISVRPDQSVDEAARLLVRNRISGLPVERDRRVVGVVSELDLIVKAGARVEQVMTAPAVTVTEGTRLWDVADHLRRIRRVPVVDADGRLVGLISRSDLLRWSVECQCPHPCPRDHEHE
jgi:CBS domain-containing protein